MKSEALISAGEISIGKYRLIRQLGAGAAGTVYLAEDTTLGREVALKVLHATLSRDEGFITRFKLEARVVASFSHPNIVKIHAIDFVDGQFMIDSEYVVGGALSVLCRRTLFDGPSVARIGRDVLAGLACCHSKGILHRDIKPSNILLGQDGHGLLADFGLAKALVNHLEESMQSETATGIFLGTPRYASPESWDGNEHTTASDIYSAGMVLYELIAGNPPYTATTPLALIREMIERPVQPLDCKQANISTSLAALVNSMIQWDPKLRPPDASTALAVLMETPECDTLPGELSQTLTHGIPNMHHRVRYSVSFMNGLDARKWSRRTLLRLGILGAGSVMAGVYATFNNAAENGRNVRSFGVRALQTNLLEDRIPASGELALVWQDVRRQLFQWSELAPDEKSQGVGILMPETDDGVSRLVGYSEQMLFECVYTRSDQDHDVIRGNWAALEDAAQTVLRYGSIEGLVKRDKAGELWTIRATFACDQDSTRRERVLLFSVDDAATDTSFFLDMEQRGGIQILLHNELLPRRFAWAEFIELNLPALSSQQGTFLERNHLLELPEKEMAEILDTLWRSKADQNDTNHVFPAMPFDLGAECLLLCDSHCAVIAFRMKNRDSNAHAIKVYLAGLPTIVGMALPLVKVVLSSRNLSALDVAESGSDDLVAQWSLGWMALGVNTIAWLRIPFEKLPWSMERPQWRMNAELYQETGANEPKRIACWGFPEVDSIVHGARLRFEVAPNGWI